MIHVKARAKESPDVIIFYFFTHFQWNYFTFSKRLKMITFMQDFYEIITVVAIKLKFFVNIKRHQSGGHQPPTRQPDVRSWS